MGGDAAASAAHAAAAAQQRVQDELQTEESDSSDSESEGSAGSLSPVQSLRARSIESPHDITPVVIPIAGVIGQQDVFATPGAAEQIEEQITLPADRIDIVRRDSSCTIPETPTRVGSVDPVTTIFLATHGM